MNKLIKYLSGMLLAVLLGACATSQNKDAERMPVSQRAPEPTTAPPQQPPTLVPPPAPSVNKPTQPMPAKKTDAEDRFKLYPATGSLINPGAIIAPDDGKPGEEVVLNFDGADLREVVKIVLVDILKETYIIDPKVQGVVNIHSSNPIKRSALVPTLEAVLRMNGASMVRESDGVFHITAFANAAKGALSPQVLNKSKALPPGYSVQIVPLKYISAKEMVKILEPFTPDGGVIRVDEVRNFLFLGGNARELRHLMETIDIFDVDWISGMSVGMFRLKSVDVKTAFSEIDKIFGDKAQGPLSGVLRIIPIERMNSILVITPQPKYLEQAKIWIERLDFAGSGSGGVSLHVYEVQNGKAEKLAALLSQAYGGKRDAGQAQAEPAAVAPGLKPTEISTGSPFAAASNTPSSSISSAPKTGGTETFTLSANSPTKIIADKDNNALIIMATPSEYEGMEQALRKLDVVGRQVLIEVTIAEITLSGELKYGLEWYFNNGSKGNGWLDIGAAGITPLTPGLSYTWLDPTGSVKAVLNALADDSKLNIIASPHIMVKDNHTAKIQVGDQVPTVSQTQSGITGGITPNVISSIQYLNTGVILSVTPRINAGGLVTMEINQEVSLATKTTSSGIDSPTISKRTAQSTLTIQNNETMVLGGLILDKSSNGSSGIPFLSEIPLVGGLFGSQQFKDDRTELVMVITPKVVNDTQQARMITEEFRKKVSSKMLERTRQEFKWAQKDEALKEAP
ncbi:MAG: type II secretion system secretin GspD [Sulfuricellaceae bacterium]|nr:type II secretion system secretin GspD [Sulfuricellaceae bacterium]